MSEEKPGKLTLERLDEMAAWLWKPGIGKVEMFFAGLQLLAVFAYVWARRRLEQDALAEERRKFERDRPTEARNEILADSLDGN